MSEYTYPISNMSLVFFLILFTGNSNHFSYSINYCWLFYFPSAFISSSPSPFSPLTGVSSGPGSGEMVTGSGWLLQEPHSGWEISLPTLGLLNPVFSQFFQGWKLAYLYQKLGTISNVILHRNHSPCHQKRKRDRREMSSYIWNLALSAIWNLPPRLCLALAWRQGCCVAQGGAKTNMGTKPNTWLQEMFWKL